MAKRILVQYTSHWNGSRVAFTAETLQREENRLVCRGCRTLSGIQMAPVLKVDLADEPQVSRIQPHALSPERHSEV